MTTTTEAATETHRSLPRRASAGLHRHGWLRLTGLLSLPMAWLVVAYLGSLLVMFIAAFWTINDFTGAIEHQGTLDNFRTLINEPVYRKIAIRSIEVAALVTVIDAALALPM